MGLAKLAPSLLRELSALRWLPCYRISRGKTVVLDLGANVDCDSTMLVQFAVMGAVLAEEVIGIKNPRVALLNIGEEDERSQQHS